MKIKQMPTELANKIAAGEVVERPASVVKELVENSIDAGSTFIKIDLDEAGITRIKVTDNGDGMTDADSERAFLAHATSKINNEMDLFHVRTLGFRGEALASIAAVSKLTLKTSTGEEAGTILALEGGEVVERNKSDARKGTEITVEQLFYNTPARLKYMKSLHTELGHITDLLNRLALSYPEIRFEAIHNGRTLFKTSGSGDLLQVIAQVYGMSVARKMLPVHHESLDYEITGYIARPEVTRASRNFISTIINGRYIKNYPLAKAVIDGYHTMLTIGKFPLVVLKINMDPILVDVNVHPTKLEVRFSKDKELYESVKQTIRTALRQETLIPEIEYKQPQEKQHLTQEQFIFSTPKEDNKQPVQKETIIKETTREIEPFPMESVEQQEEALPRRQPSESDYFEPIQKEEMEAPRKMRIPLIYPIGQLHGTYILGQNEEGFYMIDQHAAQERIKYEFFRDKLGQPANDSQQLLIPLTFEFSNQEALFIEAYKEDLEKVGLYFEPFGEKTYIIRSCPNWFPKGFEEDVIRDIIEQIMKDEKINIGRIREEAAIMMACKRSIKANHHLTKDDMFRLIEDLRTTTDPFTCPHGRPIIIHFSSYELEKMFKRSM
ncbi:DNA mismatch repair endonuclease MutL [Oceanobacillus alkalisoli]|uniref:DNA mismatch repair endonuclease MutL n=1 Tax=Oceanobacillus alkalisoli TaxID=2925113 RepID=UPI001F11BF20|nr:DNA mismatch repair endonuclease MutL [Oceanobacillus alkalisoli]MCF3942360.1 DNA mismatch repair endonuclease MutL [Oceanobacillus alkalisoli]